MPTQDEIFKTEGNEWFKRNKNALSQNPDDKIIELVTSNNFNPKNILDIGCSNGFLLNSLVKRTAAKGSGVDISTAAITDGQQRFPDLQLFQGVSHNLNEFADNTFDLIVLRFVLHWVDRTKLLTTISEVDRVLQNRGRIIIQDFNPDTPTKTKYHHLPEQEVYTYKQKYWQIFEASNLYQRILEERFLHSPKAEPTERNFCKLIVLQKDLDNNYQTK